MTRSAPDPWSVGPDDPVLDAAAVHIWRVSLEPDHPAAEVAARRPLLSPDEIERAGRFRSQTLGDRFVLCRGAVRIILGRYLGRSPRDLVFEYEPQGKPRVSGAPGGPIAAFNVSHSGALALVALTLGRDIGVDVEKVRALRDADAIAARFFAADECASYRALPRAEQSLGFFNCWTRKEAFIKALGTGLSLPLQSFDVTLAPEAPARLLRIDPRVGDERQWSLHSFEPAKDYVAAVAVKAAKVDLSFRDFAR